MSIGKANKFNFNLLKAVKFVIINNPVVYKYNSLIREVCILETR